MSYPGLCSFTKLKLVFDACGASICTTHSIHPNQRQLSNQRRIIQGRFTYQIQTIWSRNNYVYPLILDTLFNYPSISVGFPTEVDFTCLQFRNNCAHFMRNGIECNSVQYNILN